MAGDPARQAIASLRGYAYQLYASALAWIALEPEETLHLEVAEDYAVAARERLNAVQVKDTAGSGGLTLRHPDVLAAIDAYVDLVTRNPTRFVRLHFLSTAEIGVERATADRPAGVSGLKYWRRAAAGAEIAPLRTILLSLKLSDATLDFIRSRDDDALREGLFRRIHWQATGPDLEALRGQLDLAAARIGEPHGLTVEESRRLAGQLAHAVLERILSHGARILTPLDLRAQIETLALTAVPRRDLAALLQGGLSATLRPADQVLQPLPTAMPSLLARRPDLVAQALGRLQADGVVALTGGTGVGKSLLARLTAAEFGGDWRVLDLYGLDGPDLADRVSAAIATTTVESFDGLIFDDLNGHDDPHVHRRVGQLIDALRRLDRVAIITSYTQPGLRCREALGADPASLIGVSRLSARETAALVADADSDPDRWAKPIYFASGPGHPQLVQAMIGDFRRRGWPLDDLKKIERLDVHDLAVGEERDSARRRLRAAAPAEARRLLDRLDVVLGSFSRDLALSLATIPPPAVDAGVLLDDLVGPWIDRLADGEYRLSPLLKGLAVADLTPAERLSVDQHIAEAFTATGRMDVEKIGSAYIHALAGKSTTALRAISIGVLTAPQDRLGALARWTVPLRVTRTDAPIYPDDPDTSRLLRLAQALLELEAETPRAPAAVWEAVKREITDEADVEARQRFELVAYAKLLQSRNLARFTDDWLAALIRLDELSSHPAMAEVRRSFEAESRGEDGPSSITAFLFLNLALGVPSVARLEVLFQQLDRLETSRRDGLLAELSKPGNSAQLLNHPWLEEQDAGTLDPVQAAETYDRISSIAESWADRGLALRAQLVRAVMFDEYAEDQHRADEIVEATEARFGPDIAIIRARSKMAYRRKDFAAVLALSEELVNGLSGDVVERVFAIREAAVSAGSLLRWEDAARLFALAYETAAATPAETMLTLAAGLIADQAVSTWKAGRRQEALRLMGEACERLRDIDPTSTVRAGYVHRLIRNAVVWMNGQATGTDFRHEGEPFEVGPGLCSRPDPDAAIQDLPLADIEGAWYLLAAADLAMGGEANEADRLRARLNGKLILSMEFEARLGFLQVGARTASDAELFRLTEDFLQACAYATDFERFKRDNTGLPAVDGPFPIAQDIEKRSSAVTNTLDQILMFVFLMRAFEGHDASEGLQRLALALHDAGYGRSVWADGGPFGSETLEVVLVELWRELLRAERPLPSDVFVTALRTLGWCASSTLFGRALGAAGSKWIRGAFRTILQEQTFALRSPRDAAKTLEPMLRTSRQGYPILAEILLAARPYFGVSLSSEYLENLASLAKKTP